MIRCCVCRMKLSSTAYPTITAAPTDLPGSGWRCADRADCAGRVRSIVSAHVGLAEIVG